MIKVMDLDMFCFEYHPVFSKNETVIYENGSIFVMFEGNRKQLGNTDILNVQLDTLFSERIKQNWSIDEITNALEDYDRDNQKIKEEHNLFFVKPEDLIPVSAEFMLNTLLQLNYETKSFEYSAYGE